MKSDLQMFLNEWFVTGRFRPTWWYAQSKRCGEEWDTLSSYPQRALDIIAEDPAVSTKWLTLHEDLQWEIVLCVAGKIIAEDLNISLDADS